MIKHSKRLPYRTPDASAPVILPEHRIASDSSNDLLDDLSVTDIYDDEFNPLS